MLCFVLPERARSLSAKILHGRELRTRTAILALAGVCPMLAVALSVVELLGGPDMWNVTSWYVMLYAIVNLGLLGVPQDSWRRLEAITSDIEADIRKQADRARLVRIVHRAIRMDLQVGLGLVGLLAGIAGAFGASSALGVPAYAAVPFALSIGLTVLLQTNVVMWTLCGYWWVWIWTRLPSLRFDAYDPLQSPGLRGIYQLLNRGQWYLTGGLVLVIIPLVMLYSQARDSTFLGIIVVTAGVAAGSIVVLAYIVPPLCLRGARARDREALLAELRASHRGIEDIEREILGTIVPLLSLYSTIRTRSVGGVDSNRVTGLIGALASVAAPFLPLVLGG